MECIYSAPMIHLIGMIHHVATHMDYECDVTVGDGVPQHRGHLLGKRGLPAIQEERHSVADGLPIIHYNRENTKVGKHNHILMDFESISWTFSEHSDTARIHCSVEPEVPSQEHVARIPLHFLRNGSYMCIAMQSLCHRLSYELLLWRSLWTSTKEICLCQLVLRHKFYSKLFSVISILW